MEGYLLSKMAFSVIRALLIAVVILAGPIQSPPVWAQSAELDAAFTQHQALKKQGKHAVAIPFVQTFIELAEKEFRETHQIYAAGLNNLALLYCEQGRYDDAAFGSSRSEPSSGRIARVSLNLSGR